MNIREIFVNNLKNLMLLNSKSQSDLIDDLGIKQSTVSSWFTMTSFPRANAIQMLADYFDVNISELIAEDKGGLSAPIVTRVSIYSRLTAGATNYIMADVIGFVEVPTRQTKLGELIALRAKGDYMSPKIEGGDTLIIRLQTDVVNNDIVVLTIGNDDAIVRKIIVADYGVTLIPLNQSYEVMSFSNSDIRTLPIKIIGKVIECRRVF